MRTYPFIHSSVSFGSWLIAVITLLLALALTLALTLTFWIGIPIYVLVVLLLLPNALYAIFRSAILLPFLLWHYLHYLFVPHPAEGVFLKHQKMRMERGVKIDRAALGEELSTVMYNKEREGLPAWWKSENWTRRLKDLHALRGRVGVEKAIVDDETEDVRERNKRRRRQK